MIRALVFVVCLLPGAAFAQDKAQTLADLKTELAALSGQFLTLKQELVTSGATQTGAAGGDALQRLDAIEATLTQLTAKAEEVELRLNRVVQDGTNRIGDIEFRLCEVTEGCDLAALPETPVLGGATGTAPAPAVTPTEPVAEVQTPQLAVNEQADFDRAKGVLAQGDFRTAADLFATYAQTYPGGSLMQEALVLRGDALTQAGDTANAARAYLEAFSGSPDGTQAGPALLKLGQSLGALGQTPEACVTLTEVGARFPGSPSEAEAVTALQGLGCQ